jgi:hypothetical protein
MTRHSTSAGRLGTGLLALFFIAGCRAGGAGEAGLTGPTGAPTTPPPPESARRSITLTWNPPTTNEDGSPLTDLAGHRLYYGTISPLTAGNSTSVDVGAKTTHTIADLEPGTYYVSVSAYDTRANEGPRSAEVRFQVLP